MNYRNFLTRVCVDGRHAAATDYRKDADKLEGAERGFLEAGATEDPVELAMVLESARRRRQTARDNEDRRYWLHRTCEAEIEWVANVVSAALMTHGLPTIIPPTMRGILKASEILGETR